ncbi:MAG: hypothetical protein HGA45_18350 [Chloroflexales bacterium]|nr:hypothetical protein [Chloroflexales bacterium]
MSDQGPRRRGRAVPTRPDPRRAEGASREGARHDQVPSLPDQTEAIDDQDIPAAAMAAVGYLMQRGRFLDVTESITRVRQLEDGRLCLSLSLAPGQPPVELESQQVVASNPSAAPHRRLVMVTNGQRGEDITVGMLTAFRATPRGLNADIALQALVLVRGEIGEAGVERMAEQWLRGGPWAWLDPEQPGDAPLRTVTDGGPGAPLDDAALRRTALAGGPLPRLGKA